MQKRSRRLTDKNSVSFQMFLILLSSIAVGLESKISVDQVTLYSSNVKGILRCLGIFFGGGACAEAKISNSAYRILLGSICRVLH